MTEPTAKQVTEHAVNADLKPHLSDTLTEREGFCFQFLGLDSEGRGVFYASDDGMVLRYRYVESDHELDREDTEHIGYRMDSDSARVDPFLAAFVYLTERGEGWTWVHPRFRWALTELDGMTD